MHLVFLGDVKRAEKFCGVWKTLLVLKCPDPPVAEETEEREQKAKLWAWSVWVHLMHTWTWANWSQWERNSGTKFSKGRKLVLFVILYSGYIIMYQRQRIPQIPIITTSNVADIPLFSANFSYCQNMEINKSKTSLRPKLLHVHKTCINIYIYITSNPSPDGYFQT